MIDNLPQMFSSKSRTALLFILAEMTVPVCLSELAELAKMSVCATQAALKQLHNERWVRRSRQGKETVYWMNREHADAPLLQLIATTVRHETIRRRAQQYGAKAQMALAFLSETRSFLSNVKSLNAND